MLQKLLKLVLLLFLIATGLVGCAESPLLNHQVRSKSQTGESSQKLGCTNLSVAGTSLCYQVIWLEGPRVSQESRARIIFDSNTVIDLEQFELWMPDMGHGSAPTSFSSQDGVVWEVNNIYFIMPGYWEIYVQGKVRQSHESFRLTLPLRL